jgi:predicted metalloprotease
MRWEGNRESDNIEDRRGAGGFGGFGLGGRSIGIGTVVIALLGGWLFGINPLTMLGLLSQGGGTTATSVQAPHHAPANDPQTAFVRTILASTEDVWSGLLRNRGGYTDPELVLYRGSTPTACGTGQAAMGPFYCPRDQHVYLDMDFFDTLRDQLGAPGEFAEAYVIAHEVGHHVQNLLGITDRAERLERGDGGQGANGVSVRVELQADCFAGVWAHHAEEARHWMDPGDIESALNAASQIGDDTLQRRSQGTIVPDSFTHGTSAQRVAWFRRGWDSGDIQQCDTFATQQL